MAQSDKSKTSTKRPITLGQKLIVAMTVGVFVMMTLFYTMLPIAGLQLLPFLFFGCICLIVGVADDLGLYR
jgi:hypothetical protein